MNQPSAALDTLTRTFSADLKFFDALMTGPAADIFVEMCVWDVWLNDYLLDIQNSLHDGAAGHGGEYQLWIVSMLAGVAQPSGMLMYLLARGIVIEAAASGRRALEYLGMLSHLVRCPEKAQYLRGKDAESAEFTTAFIRGQNRREAEQLKADGIRYRFAAMQRGMAQTASTLYNMFSRFNVHGGTMSSLISVSVNPTECSCAFHNRSLEWVEKNLKVFRPVLEVAAIEIMDLVGKHGVKTKRVNEAGACVLVWLDHTDLRWLERVDMMREYFGLRQTNREKPM